MEDVEDLIEEIVCIYKKIRQGREYRTYQFKTSNSSKEEAKNGQQREEGLKAYKTSIFPKEETKIKNVTVVQDEEESNTKLKNNDDVNRSAKIVNCFDFNKHILKCKKYLFYSENEGLKESDNLIVPRDFEKFFWINIFDPNMEDFGHLSNIFQIHETTIAEIREKNSPEKIDVYRNYAYISLKMFVNKKSREDINFNVIVFDNFIVTTHNKQWQGVNNILNFCHAISKATILNPSWVFMSIIIEFLQDILFSMDEIEKQTDSFSTKHSVKELQSNFFYLQQVFVLKQYTRPKIKILRKFLRTDFPKSPVKKLLKMCIKDFLDIKSLLGEAKRSFERNQDMILGLRDIELAEQSHQMNVIMNRISKITFLFLPIQCIAGIWGMNVRVPWQDEESTRYFWLLTLCGPVLCFLYFFLTENRKKSKKSAGVNQI
ncbi:uncharacterized protein VICG_01684 [Vittaforma corneae ATCC 50505]|uniref:Magnesium and cobalt transporter CorA n=1 Tax=Vittaforma corneae (strain ATCC 50505) TaxID=993615 RepID=L2GKD4_VITCO|nr:uncharacterized protein VICG_01684 [Vittaforma corneae ATCC 50505]ELA41311.1 hypothetical protein VICG_01684 [Vittaforma corneae ATCC 50505]